MKISILGSHSTGKTSLVEAVGLRLKGLCPNDAEVISETARKVLALGFPTNQDEFFETCYKFLEVQLQAERNCKSKHVISDRSLVDFRSEEHTSELQSLR